MLTTKVKLRKVEAVINPLAGSVGASALDEMRKVLSDHGLSANVQAVEPRDLSRALQQAIGRNPDLLIVLAGDGTARAACELAGETGPLVAPLPGGTMNVLPKALYGSRDWKAALAESLSEGVVRDVSGGEVDGKRFFVGGMLGWPALWARAREAARDHRPRATFYRARNAWRRAFTGHVHFCLDDGTPQRAEAVTLLCPLVSKRMQDESALEVGALNPKGFQDVARIGIRALTGDVFGDWREDPAVDMGTCLSGRAWARGDLPAWLDGEPTKLSTHVRIAFHPKAFRALTPAAEDPKSV